MPTRAGPRAAVKESSRAGSAFFTLFGLPFLAGGLWAGVMALRALGRPTFDGQTFSLQAIFAITFCGVGAGLVWWGRYSAGKAREIAHLKAAHPESPWMWKPEWAGGRIVGSTKATMVFTWVFAIFWNLVSAPLLFVVPREVLEKQNYLGLIGLLFPVVGVGLLYWAARATARWKKFGSSVFEMAAVPGLVGGRLGGTIQTNFVAAPQEGFNLKLTSLRRRRGRGKNSSTTERILWQEEQTIPRERLRTAYRGTSIPVEFRIPYECDETNETNYYDQVIWRLEAVAEVSGIDYKTQFEAPVFKTAESRPAEAEEESAAGYAPAAAMPFDPTRSSIEVRPSTLGGTEYCFGAARNVGAAISLTVFFFIWMGAIWLQLYLGAPLFFPIVCGLLGAVLLLFVIDLWFSSTTVVIESGMVKIKRTTLGIGGTKQIPCSDISDVQIKIGMQQGQTATQSAKAYYDIKIHRKNGKKVSAGRNLRDKREAEWLAAEMKAKIEAFR